jgi:hypothetical protein
LPFFLAPHKFNFFPPFGDYFLAKSGKDWIVCPEHPKNQRPSTLPAPIPQQAGRQTTMAAIIDHHDQHS